MPKKFYSVKETSKILGVSTNTVYKYLDQGSLKGKRHSSRGRFKVPYSEIEPYLAGEEPTITTTTEEAQVDKWEGGANLQFFELGFGILLIGFVAIYFLWNFGQDTAGSKISVLGATNNSSLLKDIGNATLGYSGRTFSEFGNLVSRILPAPEATGESQSSNESTDIQSSSLIQNVSEDISDLNDKIQETESRTYELYVNSQVLSSSTQRLLGISRTLTRAELNEAISEMSLLLGSLSDSSDKKTIFAEINWLDETWNFPTVEAVNRAASQISYILDSLQRASLGAFTKPEIADINNLVSETDALQRLVGNISDSSAEKTLYGDIREVEGLGQALDIKSQEIDKVLGSWDSYNISEKEDYIKSILSGSSNLNILPKIDEIILSGLLNQGSDQELKDSLLTVKGILEANQIYIAQKAGKPIISTWLESGGDLIQILVVNPSASVSQEVAIKHYLPFEIDINNEQVSQIDGLNLRFDSQKNKYYLEGSLTLGVGEVKTIGLQVGDSQKVDKKKVVAESSLEDKPVEVLGKTSLDEKPSDKVVGMVMQNETTPKPSNILVNRGQVAGVKSINNPVQNMVVWGSIIGIIIFIFGLLAIYFKWKRGRGKGNHKQGGPDEKDKVTSILLPEDKLNSGSVIGTPGILPFLVSIVAFLVRVVFTTANLVDAIVSTFKKVASTIVNTTVTHSVKIPHTVVNGALHILNSIVKLGHSAIVQLDFQNPGIHKSSPGSPKIAILLLVCLTSAAISTVLAYKLMSVIKPDSQVVSDIRDVNQAKQTQGERK